MGDAIEVVLSRAAAQAAAVKEAQTRRNYLIRVARSEGATFRQIAEATKLSHSHVRNIVERASGR